MKIAINKSFGGFNLSPLAVKRLAELEGKECYFFKHNGRSYVPITLEEAMAEAVPFAFTIPNPNEYFHEDNWHEMTVKEKQEENRKEEEVSIDNRPKDRRILILSR